MGNIATYTDSNGTMTYTYDNQGQLLSATDGTTTYSYTYDTVGNILTGNGHTYTYGDTQGWEDLLTAVDGESITYDAIGNPTSYYNGTRWTFGWEQGRRLATATDGTTNLSFAYDANGIRTTKTVGNVTHTYYYAGGKLLREVYGNNTLDFFYDASGNAYAVKYNGTVYYYITNLQGDVMQIVNADGAAVATYSYDPYGNVLTATGDLAEVNPLRYRGYYYDHETGLYYLQSRYYDPEVGRFLNADDYVSTGGILGYNMFAYCLNNPVMLIDKSGQIPDSFAGGIGQDLGELIYEWLTGDEHPSKAAEEQEVEIRQRQNKLIRDGAIVIWDAYTLSIELEAEAQHQQAMRIISETEYIISDPWRTTDLVTGGVGLGLTYIGYAAAAAGVSIPVVGQVAMGVVGLVCGVYGIMRILYPSENTTQNMP